MSSKDRALEVALLSCPVDESLEGKPMFTREEMRSKIMHAYYVAAADYKLRIRELKERGAQWLKEHSDFAYEEDTERFVNEFRKLMEGKI